MGTDRSAAARCALDGRKKKHPRREIVDAILYIVRTGCAWRQLPADFPPWQTVYWHFVRWEDQGMTQQIVNVLRRWCEQEDRRPQAVRGHRTLGLLSAVMVRPASVQDRAGATTLLLGRCLGCT
ncbi:transposase [Streptosporangium roseum]|uniref:transposase n=1 Tax=Streptosporangium roseum TaxID=2001 RepID=UPI0009DEEE9F|nr:transposase [Streptosporangium roseum]